MLELSSTWDDYNGLGYSGYEISNKIKNGVKNNFYLNFWFLWIFCLNFEFLSVFNLICFYFILWGEIMSCGGDVGMLVNICDSWWWGDIIIMDKIGGEKILGIIKEVKNMNINDKEMILMSIMINMSIM